MAFPGFVATALLNRKSRERMSGGEATPLPMTCREPNKASVKASGVERRPLVLNGSIRQAVARRL